MPSPVDKIRIEMEVCWLVKSWKDPDRAAVHNPNSPVWVEQIGGVAQLFVPAGFLVIIRFCAQDFRAWGEVQDREAADDGRIPAPWCWTCHFPDQYHRGCWGMLKNEGGLFQFCWTKYSLLCSQRCLPRWLKKRNASHWRCATPHLTW